MSTTIVIAAPDQTTTNELRTRLDEIPDVAVLDVADSSTRLEALVATLDPHIVLVHEGIGPTPALQLLRDLNIRRPRNGLILVAHEVTGELLANAMEAGARSVLTHPPSVEELSARVQATASWVAQLREHLVTDRSAAENTLGRGNLIAVAGAKGGVGSTTIATHLAHRVVTEVPGKTVCLLDLDLDSGDVATLLGTTHRLDVSDLAKVADDLSPQVLNTTIHRQANGLATIASPSRLEDVGVIGDRETLLIVSALRRQFDLVIVDVGNSISPATAAVVEAASEVVLVTTADVLSLRSVHRVLESWHRFGARDPEAVMIVLNKHHRRQEIQPESAARLVPVEPTGIIFPDVPTDLERAVNLQDPERITQRQWWQAIDQLISRLSISPSGSQPDRRATAPSAPKSRRKGLSRFGSAGRSESGQATIEFTGLVWLIVFLIVLLWQVALWGATAVFAGHAADEAARAASLGQPAAQVRAAGLSAVPGWLHGNVSVESSPSAVRVSAGLPLLLPDLTFEPLAFSTTVKVVAE